MPCISSCPECHRDLTVADETAAQRRLRCPHCQAEFLAERVLADAVPFPLAAIEIETEAETLAARGEEAGGENAREENVSEEKPVEQPVATTAAPEPHETAQSVAAEMAAAADATENAAREAQGAQVDGDHQDNAATINEPEMQPQAVNVRSTARPKGSAFGIVGQMAGMALGGLMGLAIGYYVLLWIGGPRADFLHIREKLPHWVLPHKKEHHSEPWHHSAAPRSLGDLLEEAGEPSLPAKLDDATIAEETPEPMEATTASFDQPSSEALANRPPALERMPPSDLAAAAAAHDRTLRQPPDEAANAKEPGPVGPRGFNAYSIDDLEAALGKASASLGCEYCHATGFLLVDPPGGYERPGPRQPIRVRCEQCGGKRTPGLTAIAFARLCELADAATFAQLGPDEVQREEFRTQIQAVLLRVGEDLGKTQIVGRLGSSRLENSQRLTNGILLAGTVQELGYEGPLFRIKLVLFGVPKEVVVVSEHAPQPPLARHDRVLILGSIVDSPIENLAGYTGQLTQVVWGGFPLKLLPRRQ